MLVQWLCGYEMIMLINIAISSGDTVVQPSPVLSNHTGQNAFSDIGKFDSEDFKYILWQSTVVDSWGTGVSAFNCNCLAEWCCFNILYRFLCNTLTCRQPEARINSVKDSSFVKSQSCFNDA